MISILFTPFFYRQTPAASIKKDCVEIVYRPYSFSLVNLSPIPYTVPVIMANNPQPRILILTAAFGEGHNSAAQALRTGLEDKALATVSDCCALGQPRLNRFLKWGYSFCITRLPYLWKLIFKFTDKIDMSKDSLRWVKGSRKALEFELENYRPNALISVYPLYPYFLDRYHAKTGKRTPYYVVVTDSIIINKSWLCVHPDAWLVTDSTTKDYMVQRGVPAKKIIITGFPISPVFEETAPMPASGWEPGTPPRILYFGNRKPSDTSRDLAAILEARPDISLTIVLGKNVRKLYKIAERAKQLHPGRVKIMGWTRRVPELLSTHHMVITKAGGATVHESLAAEIPMLINHVVYGQEEGNAQLLEELGGGRRTLTPKDMTQAIRDIFADDSPLWPVMKTRLKEARMKGGTRIITDLVLQKVQKNST